jgi:hypothetical protein
MFTSTRPASVKMSTHELSLLWAWVQGCCLSLYGEGRGQEEAKRVPMNAGVALWRWRMATTPEGWS